MLKRTITGLILLLILFVGLIIGGWVFSALWITSLFIAIFEQYKAFNVAGHKAVAWPSIAVLTVSVPMFVLNKNLNSFFMLLGLVYLSFLLLAVMVIFRKEPKLEDLMISLLPVFTTVLPGLCMLEILNISSVGYQRLLLLLTFLIPVIGDSGAYFIGSKYGRTKLAPAVSPKKTVEGALAGLLFSVLISISATLFASMFNVHIPLIHGLILGLLGGIVGQIGDLFASLLKRHCNIKDYGHIFPGHGGMMDRLDSVLFVSVLMYLYYLFYLL